MTMTREEFKAKVSMALGSTERETWEDFLEAVWQLHLVASNQWIPVEEELPAKRKDPLVISDKVFIRTTGGHYLSAVYDYQDKQWIDVYNIETLESNEVTHWMPMPMPPQGKEE